MIDRELLEEEIRELSRQCKCFSREGSCRACMKAEKLNDKLDIMQAEDDIIRDIVVWLRSFPANKYASKTADAIERREFRKKDSPPTIVDTE